MKLDEALREIDRYMMQMRGCTSTGGRKYNEKCIIEIMNNCPSTLNYWSYDPNVFAIEGRFSKTQAKRDNMVSISIVNHIVVDPTVEERNAPMEKGVYFIGNTSFNPRTEEKQYWVKVGKTDCTLKQRLRQYDTHCPSIYHIDYLPCSNPFEEESRYHRILQVISLAKSSTSSEWWLVDEATYLKMSKLGFRWFVN